MWKYSKDVLKEREEGRKGWEGEKRRKGRGVKGKPVSLPEGEKSASSSNVVTLAGINLHSSLRSQL